MNYTYIGYIHTNHYYFESYYYFRSVMDIT